MKVKKTVCDICGIELQSRTMNKWLMIVVFEAGALVGLWLVWIIKALS